MWSKDLFHSFLDMPTRVFFFFIVSPHIPFFSLRNHKHFKDIVQMFLIMSLWCWGQIEEPRFMGDEIEVILQVTCFWNHWEVASGLQSWLRLVELIFVVKKKRPFCYSSTSLPPWRKRWQEKLFLLLFRIMLGAFSPVYLSVTLIPFWWERGNGEWRLILQEWVRKKE